MTKSFPPNPDPPPYWFNPNAHCDFHEGSPGHDLEGCFALQAKVQELVRKNILTFKDVRPNVKDNPLSGHRGPTVNAVEEDLGIYFVHDVTKVQTPLATFPARLVEEGLIKEKHEGCIEYVTHPEGCQVVTIYVQYLMDQRVLQISYTKSE